MNPVPHPESALSAPSAEVLGISGLRVSFGGGPAIVDGLDISIAAGELLCVVGESGSGKSLTALSVMGLLPHHGRISALRLDLQGQSLLGKTETSLEQVRGNRMAMVFQEPMTSLNPVMTVGAQIMEPLLQHGQHSRASARQAGLEMLRRVRIPAAEARFNMYPHQLSGGMRQRIMIAMALICRPALLIADEPTTALDVTIQNQILRLIDDLRREMGTAVLFITHNLAIVGEIADRIAVMYAGQIVEQGSKAEIFDNPHHPYTLSLFAAMPRQSDIGKSLASIDGQVPQPGSMPPGCRFAPRCPFSTDACVAAAPVLRDMGPDHKVACWNAPLEGALP